MNISRLHWSVLALGICSLAILLCGCALTAGGYYDNGYYEPYGVDYGGWEPGYQVAPFGGGEHRRDSRGGHESSRAYRSAPASRSMPSIPSQSRSGGSQSHSGGSQSHSGGSRSR